MNPNAELCIRALEAMMYPVDLDDPLSNAEVTHNAKIDAAIHWVREVERDAESKQAKIDALMLEYCPADMTPMQMLEWSRYQAPAKEQT